MDDLLIEHGVDVLELDALDALNNEEQDSESEMCDEDSWDIDPIIRSQTILTAAVSGRADDGHINTLSESGTAGVAAAAAILSSKRRGSSRSYRFETNPAVRKRQQTRLLAKIRALCCEYCTRVGQQAVFIAAVPGKSNSGQTNNFKIVGSSPFDAVIRSKKQALMKDLDSRIAEYRPQSEGMSGANVGGAMSVDVGGTRRLLPPILVDGIPASVDEMTQAMLRNFIPVLLRETTSKGKPGWGVPSQRPAWWPDCVPWANVRSDVRTEEQRQQMSWTDALKEVVRSCYRYYGHEAVLTPFPHQSSTFPVKQNTSIPVNGNVEMQSLSDLQTATAQQILASSGPQLVLAATDANGFTIRIPISMCQITEDGSGGHQLQLMMPSTTPSLSGDSNTVTVSQQDFRQEDLGGLVNSMVEHT